MTIAKTETAALESSGILQLNGINANDAERNEELNNSRGQPQ